MALNVRFMEFTPGAHRRGVFCKEICQATSSGEGETMTRKATVLMSVLVFLAMAVRGADDANVGQSKVVLDFEDASIWMSENESPFETTPEHHTEGAKALKVQYT